MRTYTRTNLAALMIAASIATTVALFSNAPAYGGQFLPSPTVLMAEAETSEQEGMMGQGGMGGMMDQDQMGQGEMGGMGGMMNMMQQMSRMMETCNGMMESHADLEGEPGSTVEPEGEQE